MPPPCSAGRCAWGGASFTLTVVDGTRNRHAVHDPLHCFQSSGYHVGAGTTVPLRQGEGHSVCVSNPDGKATVLFWFSDGCSRHASPWRYWWQATCRRITRGLSGSEPVLVILSFPGDATAAWPEILARCPEVMTL